METTKNYVDRTLTLTNSIVLVGSLVLQVIYGNILQMGQKRRENTISHQSHKQNKGREERSPTKPAHQGRPTPQIRSRPSPRPIGQSRAKGEAPKVHPHPRHATPPSSTTWPHSPLGGTFNEVERGAGAYSGNIPPNQPSHLLYKDSPSKTYSYTQDKSSKAHFH
jgi:hypothetical protein